MAGHRTQGRRHPKNRTDVAALDAAAADPRVESVWPDGHDGVWVDLVPGYNFEGCSQIHAESEEASGLDVAESIRDDLSRVEAGEPY